VAASLSMVIKICLLLRRTIYRYSPLLRTGYRCSMAQEQTMEGTATDSRAVADMHESTEEQISFRSGVSPHVEADPGRIVCRNGADGWQRTK
jgi:hypothetical protein